MTLELKTHSKINKGEEVTFYGDNTELTLTISNIVDGETQYYRHCVVGRNGEKRFVGKITVTETKIAKTNCGFEFNIYNEYKTFECGESQRILPIEQKPKINKKIVYIDFPLHSYTKADVGSYTRYVLLENNMLVHVIIPNNSESIAGEYIVVANKTVYYNPKYTIMELDKYNDKMEGEKRKEKEKTLVGFSKYVFESFKQTNRKGFKKLLINNEVWDESESKNVKILDYTRSGGGGRFARHTWELMINNNCDISECYEGDLNVRSENNNNDVVNSSGHNPFAGLSKLINDSKKI